MVGFAAHEEHLTEVQQRPRSPDWTQPRLVPGTTTRLAGLPRVSSEPTLRRPNLPEEAQAKARRTEFRSGLSDIFSHLDEQCARRRYEHKRDAWAEQAKVAMGRNYQRALETQRKPEIPAWTFTDGPGYFSKNLIDTMPSDRYMQKSDGLTLASRRAKEKALKPFITGQASLPYLSPPNPFLDDD
mmetsp:Transcript_20339/g.52043  ORF Transcript_20339/g.52043 Transcript_20339/m.52043 type:complete len:185 (+) Transcript_20339:170-724(+)